jgi:hypothetical protein
MVAQKLVAIESLSAKMASGAINAAQNLSSPLLVPKIKIEASGRKTSGSIMKTSMPILRGRATSNPRTWRIEGTSVLMSSHFQLPIAKCRFVCGICHSAIANWQSAMLFTFSAPDL